ncbi:MAG: hypothetical protein ABL886_14400, partial [Rhodoglobus sp.]
AQWIGNNAEKVSGIVGAASGVGAAADALASRLDSGAAIVTVGLESEPAAGARPGIRSHSVVLAGGRGSRPEDVGAAVAFLFSDLAELDDGARIPIGERPADKI